MVQIKEAFYIWILISSELIWNVTTILYVFVKKNFSRHILVEIYIFLCLFAHYIL